MFDENRGLIVCEECGLVHSENHIDHGPEWRAFDADQKKKRTRTGAPMTYMIHDKGLSTMIDWKNRDIFGKEIPVTELAQKTQTIPYKIFTGISERVKRVYFHDNL